MPPCAMSKKWRSSALFVQGVYYKCFNCKGSTTCVLMQGPPFTTRNASSNMNIPNTSSIMDIPNTSSIMNIPNTSSIMNIPNTSSIMNTTKHK